MKLKKSNITDILAYITHDVYWDMQVGTVCVQSRKLLGFLYWWFYASADSIILLRVCKSLVRPLLEYGAQMWDPYAI